MSKPTNLRAWIRTSMSTSASDSECNPVRCTIMMGFKVLLRHDTALCNERKPCRPHRYKILHVLTAS